MTFEELQKTGTKTVGNLTLNGLSTYLVLLLFAGDKVAQMQEGQIQTVNEIAAITQTLEEQGETINELKANSDLILKLQERMENLEARVLHMSKK